MRRTINRSTNSYIEIDNADALDCYEHWPAPAAIIIDGPYGIGGFPGDPTDTVELPKWYAPQHYDDSIRIIFQMPYNVPPSGDHCYAHSNAAFILHTHVMLQSMQNNVILQRCDVPEEIY